MQEDRHFSITLDTAGLTAGIDDVNRRLRAVLARRGGFRRRPLPSTWTPPRMPCLGREDELAELKESLATGRRHVVVHGPRGIGKTTLLYRAATLGILATKSVPDCDGVLWSGRAVRHADDLVHDLFAGCYLVKPDTVVPDDIARRLLRSIRALVVLDNVSLPEDEVRTVIEAMPDSRFVITAAGPDPPGFGHVLPLGGLSLDSAVQVVAARLDQSLTIDAVRHLTAVWEDYEGHPGRLVQLAADLRTAGTRGAGVRIPTPEELPLIVPRLITGLDPSPRRALKVLAAVPDAEWGVGLLAALSDTTEKLGAHRLTDRHLASTTDGRRYRLAPDVSDHLPAGFPIPVTEIAARLTVWLYETVRPIPAAAETEVIERTLEATLTDGQHLAALVLARAASAVIMNSGHWSAWRRILLLGRRAARAVGSVPDWVYFTYGLAAWFTANRQTDEAIRLLELVIGSDESHATDQALALREQIDGAAFEWPDLIAPVAAPGLVARLARTPDTLRAANLRIVQLPAVQSFLRFASENPILVRVTIGVVTVAFATAVTLAALPQPGAATPQAIPGPGATPGHNNQPVPGATPTGNQAPPGSAAGTIGSNPNAPNAPGGGYSPAGPIFGPTAPTSGTTGSSVPPPSDTIDIDASGTDYIALSISGVPGSFNARQIQHVHLSPGPHTLSAGYSGTTVTFQVTADRKIEYAHALDGTFTGRDTSTLTVHGSPITLSTDVDWQLVGFSGITQTTERRHTFRLLPGQNFIQLNNERSYRFTVAGGQINYDHAMEGRLTGAGTATLTLHASPIELDTTDVDNATVGVSGTFQTTDRRHIFRLVPLPGSHYYIVPLDKSFPYYFNIQDDGTVTYDHALEGHLTGAGSKSLAVHGFSITIDARNAGQSNFILAGVGVNVYPAQQLKTFRLLPITYVLTVRDGQLYLFQVDQFGHVEYDHSLDSNLSGRDSTTLTVR
ncbi:MAG TPA: hypothetical protein VEO01_36755 [Pseudonocardiaceae bacterium]|nr:hypothetical protein [Pseudonocardiaceae bacterium]